MNEFLPGALFRKEKKIGIIAIEGVVALYFFVYLFIMQNSGAAFSILPLLAIFAGFGLIIGVLTSRIVDKYKLRIRYVVTDTELLVGKPGKERHYKLDEIVAVRMEKGSFFSVYPVLFVLDTVDDFGKKVTKEIKPAQTVNVPELAKLVISRVKSHAEIEQAVYERIKTVEAFKA